jgi:hypothetical protein
MSFRLFIVFFFFGGEDRGYVFGGALLMNEYIVCGGRVMLCVGFICVRVMG